jgi:anaerobic magnesium-protoporphyrin IX monomethyl ester cyclase
MADLLLTHGYFLYEDPKELQIMKPYVPLGLLYLCSHLRQRGFNVDVFDTTFSARADLFRHLQTETPTVLGIYANLMTRGNVLEVVRVAHEAGWTCVVGGPEPGAYADEYLHAGADVVVFGEGELTLEELLPALKQGGSIAHVAGIAYRDVDGSVRRTAERLQIKDLDAQPWPARDQVDIPRYVKTWRDAHGQGSVSFITARGCPYKCRWCSHQVFGMTHRRRNATKVVDEVDWLLNQYSPDMMWVADDVFTIHHGWMREYAAEMRRRGLKIPFECISRADRFNEEMADLLAELGCFRLWIGSESGSQRILDSMERGVTVEQVQRSVELCRSRGIQSGMFLMWGYEGEELPDIEATIEHVKRSDPDIFFTTVAYPIKGTKYYERVANQVVKIKQWNSSSDRDLLVAGRHSRSYYQYADTLLRSEVALARLQRGSTAIKENAQDLRARISSAREGLAATSSEVEA